MYQCEENPFYVDLTLVLEWLFGTSKVKQS